MTRIPPELGKKVVTRETSWLDLAMRAWGTEFNAPDHGVYEFSNGRKYDSTDKSDTGFYNGGAPSPAPAPAPSPSAPAACTLVTDTSLMTHFTTYNSYFPLATGIAGAFDPATTGSNVTLAGSNLTASWAGAGSAAGSTVLSAATSSMYVFEVSVLGASSPKKIGFYASGLSVVYNKNLNLSSLGTGATYIDGATGTIHGYGGNQAGLTWGSGDIIGVVLNFYTNQMIVFVNGAEQSAVSIGANSGMLVVSA